MRKYKYGWQLHSTYAYYCWAKHLLVFLWVSDIAIVCTNGSLLIWLCTVTAFQSIPMIGICVYFCWIMAYATSVLSSGTSICYEWKDVLCYWVLCTSPPFPYDGVYNFEGSLETFLTPLPVIYGRSSVSLQMW